VTFKVAVTRAASEDINRLESQLKAVNPRAAIQAGQVLNDAIASLDTFPNRGRKLSDDARELVVRFGAAAYLIRYVVREDTVLVTRILHSRERH
jgi:plasmid stabilization system protein ParE